MSAEQRIFRRPTLTSTVTSTRVSDLKTREVFMTSIAVALQAEPLAFANLLKEQNKVSTDQQIDRVKYSQDSYVQPTEWSPKLKLPPGYKQTEVILNTLEVAPLSIAGLCFSLAKSYSIGKILPRSFFGIICQCSNNTNSFVFSLGQQSSEFFEELSGLRQSVYVNIEELNTKRQYELHLKPSKGVIFGYICVAEDIQKIINDQIETCLRARKLPLVLDLDDTLVRMVGNSPGRYVSEADIHQVPLRVRELKDGRKIVIAERVQEFLVWAAKYFDISVCSLGDQSYVDMVVQVLNAETGGVIRGGVTYSARGEYLYLSKGNTTLRRPPKDLNSLYAFYFCRNSLKTVQIEPLILDDNATMWPQEQQDNIIIIKEKVNSPVWNVALFPIVQNVLGYIHEGFYHNWDLWNTLTPEQRGEMPSSLTYYKEFLRKELSNHIGEC